MRFLYLSGVSRKELAPLPQNNPRGCFWRREQGYELISAHTLVGLKTSCGDKKTLSCSVIAHLTAAGRGPSLSAGMTLASFVTHPLPIRFSHRPHMTCCCAGKRRDPILVADVLDTLVVDPFFNGMSSYFGFSSFDDFIEAKTPGLWVNFEEGRIGEVEAMQRFFKDRRHVDICQFKRYLKESYCLVPGVSPMLSALKEAQVEVHLCTNYPVWADLIEEALHLTERFGVHWTFVSGREGVRKPDKEAFLRAARNANVDPSACILLDDRKQNCDGAMEAGFLAAIPFENAKQAGKDIQETFSRYNVTIGLATNIETTASELEHGK